MPNYAIEDHPLLGTEHVYRDSEPPYTGPIDSTVVVAPGMAVQVRAVFTDWNDVTGLDMLYVHVPATGHHTHVTPGDLGIGPLRPFHFVYAYRQVEDRWLVYRDTYYDDGPAGEPVATVTISTHPTEQAADDMVTVLENRA